jgi:hypothetical protein
MGDEVDLVGAAKTIRQQNHSQQSENSEVKWLDERTSKQARTRNGPLPLAEGDHAPHACGSAAHSLTQPWCVHIWFLSSSSSAHHTSMLSPQPIVK